MSPQNPPLESARLLLRPWQLSDAPALFRHARSARVGPRAGWPPHTSEAMSREVIRTLFSEPETYAVVLKSLDEPIGCIGLVPRRHEHYGSIAPDQREIGYWLGEAHWGNGYIPEAVELLAARYTALSDHHPRRQPQLPARRPQVRFRPPALLHRHRRTPQRAVF